MKLINRNTDYAIQALNYINGKEGKTVSVTEIAQKLKIPYAYLRRILQILKKSGVLKSFEGRSGGFVLSRSSDKIFLQDLIRIFQGPLKFTDCLFKKGNCPDAGHCLLKKKIEHIEHLTDAELKGVTLTSLFWSTQK